MGFLSQGGTVIFRTQAVGGTYQSDTGTAGVAVRTKSGSIDPNRDALIPDPEIGGLRDIPDAYLGAVSFSGSYDFYVRMQELTTFLKGALGFGAGSSSATTTGVTTHTISPANVLPWLSVEDAIGNTFETFRYTDAKINTLHLEAEANGYLMGTVGLVARLQTAGNTRTASPLFDTTPLTVGTNITVTYNGATLPAKSFSLDINNNLEDNDFRLGSFYLGEITEKRREISMGVTIRPADSGLWRQAVYGLSSATAPGGLTTKQQVVITMSTYEFISGGTPNTVASCTLTVPSAMIKPLAVDPSGDDVIEHGFEIQALAPNPATPIITAVVKSGNASIA